VGTEYVLLNTNLMDLMFRAAIAFCNCSSSKFEPGTVPSRMREGIACVQIIATLGVASLTVCPGYYNGWCVTLAEPRLAIKLKCLSTISVVIFANGLCARTDLLVGM
jgi:hypothetical protein